MKKKSKKEMVVLQMKMLCLLICVLCMGLCEVKAAKMVRPEIKAVQLSGNRVKITWSVQPEISGYKIYRKHTRSERWKVFKTVKNHKGYYVDKKVKPGQTCYYTVRPYTRVKNSQGERVIKYGPFYKRGISIKISDNRSKWQKFLDQYEENPSVNQLVFVRHTNGSRANVELHVKSSGKWKKTLDCAGYVGSNGIDKVRAGDRRTPTGTFNLTQAYGIKDDPGAKVEYVKVHKYHYWCGDSKYYNQLLDIREKPHDCHGEHLINYVPHYNYGMFLDFNKENVYGKGSAIFLHCTGRSPYTAGCVAVSEKDMIHIIKNVEKGAKIFIYHDI